MKKFFKSLIQRIKLEQSVIILKKNYNLYNLIIESAPAIVIY